MQQNNVELLKEAMDTLDEDFNLIDNIIYFGRRMSLKTAARLFVVYGELDTEVSNCRVVYEGIHPYTGETVAVVLKR